MYHSKFLFGILLTTTAYLASADEKPTLSFSTTDLGAGLYMVSGVGGFTGGNIGLSIGEDGVILIDDSMPPLMDLLSQSIKAITDKPIDFLINTHVHGDHTGNNQSFGSDGAHIIAHENLRKHLIDKGIKGAEAPNAALPVITFSESMNFHLNGQTARVFHTPAAHTDGDAVIYFKEANIIHAGDTFFNGMFPFIDFDNGGTLDGYIQAQQKIVSLANDNTQIIPGHGALADRSDLQASIDMLQTAKNAIQKLRQSGKSDSEILASNPLQMLHENWNWSFITTEKMTQQILMGLSK